MKKLSALIILSLLFASNIFSQCVMCRAVAESDLKDGTGFATGINEGIVYLMIFPYLLIFLVAAFFFKKQIKEKIKALLKH
jgi:hypothetical protein